MRPKTLQIAVCYIMCNKLFLDHLSYIDQHVFSNKDRSQLWIERLLGVAILFFLSVSHLKMEELLVYPW